ncbi:MAG: Folylpolyglutamate synthase [Burkholderiaceae bacterium]|nr:Folylpolyglutamate synthase [Burkholderiaceae bacterium]
MTIRSHLGRDAGLRQTELAAAGRTGSLSGAWYRLQALVDWERADRARMRVDLAPEIDLMARLGQPHRQFRSVHVTGTKGKGSVCALIEAALLHAGWRTGRYGSPHIEHVTERVSLLGQPIAEDLFAAALTRALDACDAACREGTPAAGASWFDVITAAAFWSFAEGGLEWAVIEVGMGGLLDSTNVVFPELAIVTNVDLEHTEVLGTTLEAIAVQKAGIIKQGRPVLTQVATSTPAGRVLAASAEALGADLQWVEAAGKAGLRAGNLALARAALVRLGQMGVHSPVRAMPLGDMDLSQQVARGACLPGRLEAFDVEQIDLARADRRGRSTRVVLDGAHVGFAITAAIDTLRRDPAHAVDPVVLLALATDKNAADIVGRLESTAANVVCTRLQGDRPAWDPTELARLCAQHGLRSEVIDDPARGLARCLELVPAGSWVLVTGSLYLVGAVRRQMLQSTPGLRVSPAQAAWE